MATLENRKDEIRTTSTNHKPATALPFKLPFTFDGKYVYDADERVVVRLHPGQDSILPYIAHAANAYPKLVEALRDPMVVYALGYVAEFAGDGGDHTAQDGDTALKAQRRIETLLRELGEAS